MRKEFVDAVRKNQYEKTESGELYLHRQRVCIGGVFGSEVWRDGQCIAPYEQDDNLVVDQGLNDVVLNAIFGQNSEVPVFPWFVSVYTANVSPAAGWTYVSYPTDASEIAASVIVASARPPYTVDAASTTQSISNSLVKASFIIDTGQSATVYGAALLSEPTLAGNEAAGRLLAASKFATSRILAAADELLVTYTIQASSA